MFGYIITKDNITNETIHNYKIHSFKTKCDISTKKYKFNIYIVKNNIILYQKNEYFCLNQYILYEIINHKNYRILKWFILNFNLKKIIICTEKIMQSNYYYTCPSKINTPKFIKTIKFKTKNKYLKGYNKH